MSALATVSPVVPALAPASPAVLAKLARIHDWTRSFPQADIVTRHILHGGMYARTIHLAPETIMNGSLIRYATILIVQGPCIMIAGDEAVRLDGYNVMAGAPGRKQSFVTQGHVEMTMVYATQAQSVEEAEDEVFAEADQLLSRRDGSQDQALLTGQ